MLVGAFVAIVVAIMSWSIGTALLLWASHLRRREMDSGEAPGIGPAAAAASDEAAGLGRELLSTDEACRSIVSALGDVELRETALMLTALAEHGRVMVASRDPAREDLARRVVDELAGRAAEHGIPPPITVSDGEVVGAAVFRAAEGLGEPLLKAAEWELAVRTPTGAATHQPAG